jgi:hypothetical protein
MQDLLDLVDRKRDVMSSTWMKFPVDHSGDASKALVSLKMSPSAMSSHSSLGKPFTLNGAQQHQQVPMVNKPSLGPSPLSFLLSELSETADKMYYESTQSSMIGSKR